jgi:methionine-rich copper-binding protein CopC
MGNAMRTAIRLTLLGLALAFTTHLAWAHAFLLRSSPPVGSDVPSTPARLTLRFTEPVEVLFCTVELRNPSGAAISVPAPTLAADDPTMMVIPLPKLGPGTYTVIWHVTSVDTHKTEGQFQFTIGS